MIIGCAAGLRVTEATWNSVPMERKREREHGAIQMIFIRPLPRERDVYLILESLRFGSPRTGITVLGRRIFRRIIALALARVYRSARFDLINGNARGERNGSCFEASAAPLSDTTDLVKSPRRTRHRSNNPSNFHHAT